MPKKKPAFKRAPYPKTAAQGKRVGKVEEDGSYRTSTGNIVDAETRRPRRPIRPKRKR